MIPKVIHYCWFGRNPLPELAQRCIASWRKYLPDYEIIEWNDDNFDVNIIPYTAEAYRAKKYAFVSDYARFYILYKYGGIYFDTDVEVIRPMDDVISRGPFMGLEDSEGDIQSVEVAPGLGLGGTPGLDLYKELIDMYEGEHFEQENGAYNTTTIVDRTTKVLVGHGLHTTNKIQQIKGLWIYPTDYFCPMSRFSGKTIITNNTRSIHHYDASWMDRKGRLSNYIRIHYGKNVFELLCKIKGATTGILKLFSYK